MARDVRQLSFRKIYPLYLAKVQKKGRTQAELDAVLGWLTGYTPAELATLDLPLAEFYGQARMNPAATAITGVVCGVHVEAITDPVMQQIRWGDKLVDELARGKAVDRIYRQI